MLQNERKVIQIADSVHGNIQISQFEKLIVNTHAFNRLHNILQNSTVYLTYPSNRTKRFEHSLGVTHLSSQMFRYSLINADPEIRDNFLENLKKAKEQLLEDDDFARILRTEMGSYASMARNFDELIFDDPLYEKQTPYNIKKEYYNVFQLINQSIRCAALLHDLGHPPFSHVTEFALKEVLNEISNIDDDDLTKRQKEFLEITNRIYDAQKGTFDLHEQIGIKIANRLLESIIKKNTTIETEEHAKWKLFYLYVQQFTLNILENKTPLFSDIHTLIDGSIDSDRLDYVTRDVQNSGFTKGKIEYDRLISTMKLMKNDDRYYFCFNVRTLSTIEDFFNRRWFLWKYVIYHHRVIKTDELLGNAVKKLALDYLYDNHSESENTELDEKNNSVIPLNISGLWKAIKLVPDSDDEYFNSLIQWDDSWLWTVLRQEYYSKYQFEKEVVKDQLEELLSNKRNYRSIIKRTNDFLEIDEEVIQNFNVDWEMLRGFTDSLVNPLIEHHRLYHENYTEWRRQAPVEGFFIGKILQLMEFLQLESDFFDTVTSKIQEAVNHLGGKDCIVTFKNLKTGLEKNPYVHNEREAFPLDEISRIHYDLIQNKKVFPIFHAYVSNAEDLNMQEVRRQIGCYLAEGLSELIEKVCLEG